MPRYFSIEEKKSYCEEFLNSNLSQFQFTASKGIGNSSLGRWMRDFGYKKSKDLEPKLKSVNVSNLKPINPIQIILTNGTRINLPPSFCSESLKLILSVCGG